MGHLMVLGLCMAFVFFFLMAFIFKGLASMLYSVSTLLAKLLVGVLAMAGVALLWILVSSLIRDLIGSIIVLGAVIGLVFVVMTIIDKVFDSDSLVVEIILTIINVLLVLFGAIISGIVIVFQKSQEFCERSCDWTLLKISQLVGE